MTTQRFERSRGDTTLNKNKTQYDRTCSRCHGTGKDYDGYSCRECQGVGKVKS